MHHRWGDIAKLYVLVGGALCYNAVSEGEVAERLMAPLSKSGSRLHRDVGSNPTLSATGSNRTRDEQGLRRGAGAAEQARLEIA